MRQSFSADNKLTEPRNNAFTTLAVAIGTTLP